MRKVLPVITEDATTLEQRVRRERNGRKTLRLRTLYRLASRQAQTRQAAARLLGVHRNTIGHWLAIYAAGGLEAWLNVSVPAGKPVSLSPNVLDALEQALRQPAGFASYEALHQWVQQTHHREVNCHPLYTLVRTLFKTKLKVARPSHTKKTLRPSASFRRAAGNSFSASARRRIPARCACSVRTKAVWAC